MGRHKAEFWGLDLETSGTEHDKHVPIQIGIAAPTGVTASWLIKGWDFSDIVHHWDERAFEVHGITQEKLEAEGYLLHEVAHMAVRFIEQNGTNWHGNRKVVGWNVGSFDMPFVRRYLPAVSGALSYQSADLNAVCFAISQAHGISYSLLKKASKDYAAEQMRDAWAGVDWHDAGYDAEAALHSWAYLTSRIKEGY